MDGDSCGEGLIAIAVAYAGRIGHQVLVLVWPCRSQRCRWSVLARSVVDFADKEWLESVRNVTIDAGDMQRFTQMW